MSLSAQREAARRPPARRARHRPDRGRLPELEPQGARAVRAAGRRDVPATREIAAFGMTRRRDVARRGRPGAAGPRRLLRAGVHAGRQDLGAAPGEGRQGRPRGEPADDRRVGRLPRRRRASGSSTTPSTSSTATPTTPTTRCAACGRRPRPAPRPSSAVTPTAARCRDGIAAAIADVVAALAGRASRVGIHCHDDAGCGVANSLAGGRGRGATHVQGTMNGYGERCGNANLVSIIPNLQLKLGLRVPSPTRSSPR